MKAFDIAFNDMRRSFRSLFAVVFMFVIPLLVTGMFYFMFGSMKNDGGFSLPRTQVIIADTDEGGPKFQVDPDNIPGGKQAETMGDLVVSILESEEMADLVLVSFAPDPASARTAVDNQQAQVALIIPDDFSKQFADQDGQAVLEFYQDPTLTIGPAVMRSILNRFMDGMAGVKIAVDVFLDDTDDSKAYLVFDVVQQYLDVSLATSEDLEAELLEVRPPAGITQAGQENEDPLLRILGPIMAGMMVFYAFFTGASTAQTILKEDEEHTLARLFTTPTPQRTILAGKLLSVFMTVTVQVVVLLIAGSLIFNIQWGDLGTVAPAAAGLILIASSFGVFINSFLKTTKQAGVLFGGVFAVTGLLGMIPIFASGSPTAATMSDTVSLFVPQGWAIRALIQSMHAEPVSVVLFTASIMLVLSAGFFIVGVWRFNQRFA